MACRRRYQVCHKVEWKGLRKIVRKRENSKTRSKTH